MTLEEIERRLTNLLAEVRTLLPEAEVEDMRELTVAGEPGIALENLCTQLFEYDVAIEAPVRSEIETLGSAMGLNTKYWSRLRVKS